MITKKKREINLKEGSNWIKAYIDVYSDLPWPEYVVHDNKVFRHDNRVRGGTGEYTRDYGFYNTLPE